MTTEFEMLLTQADIDHFTATGHWQNKILVDYLDQAAATRPEQICTVDRKGSYTYAQLAQDVEKAAHAFASLNIQSGDVIGIQLPNWYEWLVIHLGAQRVGAITNPLIPIYRDKEIGHMAKTAKVKALFIPQVFRKFNYPEMVDRLRADLPDLKYTFVLEASDPLGEGFDNYENFLALGDQELENEKQDFSSRRPDANDLALIMFTSGTTGKPKGVMHTHNTVLAASLPWPDRLSLNEESVIHMASTFGHLTGYLFGVCLPLKLGGTGVFQDIWNVNEFLELVQKFGVNHTSGASPFLHDLLEADALENHNLESLKHFCCMGAPIPRSFVTDAAGKLPNMSVFGGWGMTECGLATMGHPSDPPEKIFTTDGRPLDGMEARIVDPLGETITDGSPGKLQVKGAFLFRGYLNQLDVTKEEMDGDWYDTGDIATMDENGYVSLAGRCKDVIIRGGENIPAERLEDSIIQIPGVREVTVVGMPHKRLQEIAAAVVVMSEGQPTLTMESMQQHLEEMAVPKQYWPEYLEVTDEIPRTPSGKAQKYKVRQKMAEIAEQLVTEPRA